MEAAFDRKIHVDDFRQQRLKKRQEDSFGGLSQPRVFHRRLADHRRRIDRVAAVRDALDVKRRKALGGGVDAGMVAERAFDAQIFVVDVTFEHEFGVGGDHQVERFGTH